MPVERLIEEILINGEGVIGLKGAIMVDTGTYTGRSPNDKYFVDEPSSNEKLWWGPVNKKIKEEIFNELYDKVIGYYHDSQSTTYVFDGYAEKFEDHLVNGLSYKTPEDIFALHEAHRSGVKLNIMDLGCGTGLCGPLFKDIASTLIGVDLSKGMLAQAEKKSVYDELKLMELVSALEQEYQTQDLLIAADVLIYVGELAPLFKVSKQALRVGGKFVFSVESRSGNSFKLGKSGRYQHSDVYIHGLADKYDFEVKAQKHSVIRTESSEPVMGELYLLEKRYSELSALS